MKKLVPKRSSGDPVIIGQLAGAALQINFIRGRLRFDYLEIEIKDDKYGNEISNLINERSRNL